MTLWQMITANVALITAYVHLVYILMHPYCCLKPVPTVTDMSLCDCTNCQSENFFGVTDTWICC